MTGYKNHNFNIEKLRVRTQTRTGWRYSFRQELKKCENSI